MGGNSRGSNGLVPQGLVLGSGNVGQEVRVSRSEMANGGMTVEKANFKWELFFSTDCDTQVLNYTISWHCYLN